ncbi:hypothetical protein [Bacteroides sp. HPS0048]|uniref:hypothetical protein n=1 Tax=Bacteroides sp. HPS0048 TaxID=1078089 RepID=UPI003567D5BB
MPKTNLDETIVPIYPEVVPPCTVYFVHGRHYAVHPLARGERGDNRSLTPL